MSSYNINSDVDRLSIGSAPSINWSTWVEPLDEFPHEPNAKRRSQCEGDSNAYDAFWKARHRWDLVDYHLYLIDIEKKSQNWRVRMSDTWLIESDGSRWDNFRYAIDSDDHDCQTGWKDPLVIFASLAVPHATECPDRRIVLGVNLRTHCLVGYLFEAAPEGIADLGSVWDRKELIINLTLKRFLHLVKYSINEDPVIVKKGVLNYFRESTRRLHVGMDAVVTIKYIQFLRDALSGANLSSPYNIGEESTTLADMEEHLRNFLCRGSVNAWMSSHGGITTEDVRKRMLVTNYSSDIFGDQLCSPYIVNDVKKATRNSWTLIEAGASPLMECEVARLPDLVSLESVRQTTSDMVILLGIFVTECTTLVNDEEQPDVAAWVEQIIQRRCG